MRRVLFVLVLCSGCAFANHPRDEIRDSDIRASGGWTPKDQEARALLEAESQPAFGTAPDPQRPIRNASIARKLTYLVEIGPGVIHIPALEFLLGLRWDPKYYFVESSRAYVILRRDAPPVVIEEGGTDDGRRVPGKRNEVPSRELEAAKKLGPPIELPEPRPDTHAP